MSIKFHFNRVKFLEITAFKKTPEKNSKHGRFSVKRRLLKQMLNVAEKPTTTKNIQK